jgi:hypothetical protein
METLEARVDAFITNIVNTELDPDVQEFCKKYEMSLKVGMGGWAWWVHDTIIETITSDADFEHTLKYFEDHKEEFLESPELYDDGRTIEHYNLAKELCERGVELEELMGAHVSPRRQVGEYCEDFDFISWDCNGRP